MQATYMFALKRMSRSLLPFQTFCVFKFLR